MSLRRAITAALLIALSALPARAETARQAWQEAAQSPSARLLLFSLATRRPPGGLQTVAALGRAQGLFGPVGPLPLRFGAVPQLYYDGNINGGFPNDTVVLFGLPFQIAEDQQAKAGVVVGASLSVEQSFVIAKKTVLSGAASVAYSAAPGTGLTRTDGSARLCVGRVVADWTWIDLCRSAAYQKRQLSTTDDRKTSLRFSRLFAIGAGDHEVGLTVARLDRVTHERDSLGIDWTGALPGVGAVWVRGEVVEKAQFNDLRNSLEIGLSREIAGRPVSLSVSRQHEGGGTVFGLPRADRITAISVTTPLNQRISLRASLSDRQSTVDVYDERAVGLDVIFGGWPF